VDVSSFLTNSSGSAENPDAYNMTKTGANAGRGAGPGFASSHTNVPGITGGC
jgi:hypothetical protein